MLSFIARRLHFACDKTLVLLQNFVRRQDYPSFFGSWLEAIQWRQVCRSAAAKSFDFTLSIAYPLVNFMESGNNEQQIDPAVRISPEAVVFNLLSAVAHEIGLRTLIDDLSKSETSVAADLLEFIAILYTNVKNQISSESHQLWANDIELDRLCRVACADCLSELRDFFKTYYHIDPPSCTTSFSDRRSSLSVST